MHLSYLKYFSVFLFIFNVIPMATIPLAFSEESPMVYSVERSLPSGAPGERNERDFYISMGSSSGIKVGSVVEVLRRSPSYNLKTEKLQQDHLFPIGRLRVIYTESSTSVARLEKIYSTQTTPVVSNQAILVGDLVRIPK